MDGQQQVAGDPHGLAAGDREALDQDDQGAIVAREFILQVGRTRARIAVGVR